jgi:hypothetical protein
LPWLQRADNGGTGGDANGGTVNQPRGYQFWSRQSVAVVDYDDDVSRNRPSRRQFEDSRQSLAVTIASPTPVYAPFGEAAETNLSPIAATDSPAVAAGTGRVHSAAVGPASETPEVNDTCEIHYIPGTQDV